VIRDIPITQSAYSGHINIGHEVRTDITADISNLQIGNVIHVKSQITQEIHCLVIVYLCKEYLIAVYDRLQDGDTTRSLPGVRHGELVRVFIDQIMMVDHTWSFIPDNQRPANTVVYRCMYEGHALFHVGLSGKSVHAILNPGCISDASLPCPNRDPDFFASLSDYVEDIAEIILEANHRIRTTLQIHSEETCCSFIDTDLVAA